METIQFFSHCFSIISAILFVLISFPLLVCQFFLFDLSFFLRFEGGLAARFCRKLHDIDVQKRVTFVKLTIFMQIRA